MIKIVDFEKIPNLESRIEALNLCYEEIQPIFQELELTDSYSRDAAEARVYLTTIYAKLTYFKQQLEKREEAQKIFDNDATQYSHINDVLNFVGKDTLEKYEHLVSTGAELPSGLEDQYMNFLEMVNVERSVPIKDMKELQALLSKLEKNMDKQAFTINKINGNYDPDVCKEDLATLDKIKKINDDIEASNRRWRDKNQEIKDMQKVLNEKENRKAELIAKFPKTQAELDEIASLENEIKGMHSEIEQLKYERKIWAKERTTLKKELASLDNLNAKYEIDDIDELKEFLTSKIPTHQKEQAPKENDTSSTPGSKPSQENSTTPAPTSSGKTSQEKTTTKETNDKKHAPTPAEITGRPGSPVYSGMERPTNRPSVQTPVTSNVEHLSSKEESNLPATIKKKSGPIQSFLRYMKHEIDVPKQVLAEVETTHDDVKTEILNMKTLGYTPKFENNQFSYVRIDNDGKTRLYQEEITDEYISNPTRILKETLKDLGSNKHLMEELKDIDKGGARDLYKLLNSAANGTRMTKSDNYLKYSEYRNAIDNFFTGLSPEDIIKKIVSLKTVNDKDSLSNVAADHPVFHRANFKKLYEKNDVDIYIGEDATEKKSFANLFGLKPRMRILPPPKKEKHGLDEWKEKFKTVPTVSPEEHTKIVRAIQRENDKDSR